MGSDDRLVVKQLSKHGELVDCINCFPAKVAVLRAENERDLITYRQAISGQVSGQKFVITFNNKTAQISDFIYIGFSSFLPSEKTATELLISAGLSSEQISALFLTYGLKEFESIQIAKLTLCSLRRLEILFATFSNTKVIIFDNPFEPISFNWKEKFAELVLSDALIKRRIVLITRLDFRPQCFVGSQDVERIQVGNNVQKTVGFGSGPSEINKIVAQLRASGVFKTELSEPLQQNVASPAIIQKSLIVPQIRSHVADKKPLLKEMGFGTLAPDFRLKSIKMMGLGLGTFMLLLLVIFTAARNTDSKKVAVLSTEKSVQGSEMIQAQKIPTSKIIQPEKDENKIVSIKPEFEQNQLNLKKDLAVIETVALEKSIHEIPVVKTKKVLDAYAPEIKRAVIEAFKEEQQDPDSGLIKTKSINNVSDNSDNPFEELRYLKPSKAGSTTTYNYEHDMPNSVVQYDSGMDPSVHERQEEIRRRFLEALQRASDRE
ncbi:MAG: hypothetical protein SGJ02_11625 [bacterium]|nr:hypothetical protein [bacterium]